LTRRRISTTLGIVRRFSAFGLAAIIATLTIALVSSTSAAAYLAAVGPKECCRTNCHRGQTTSDADANRCCTTHLGVLPSALGPTSNDVHQVVATIVAMTPPPFAVVLPDAVAVPASAVRLRGSPPGTLVAASTQLLI
jgi:hypothetical protein